MCLHTKNPKIPLKLIAELIQLVSPAKGEEFGLLNSCELDWTVLDLAWMERRGDIKKLPRFLELAEQVNQVLMLTPENQVITNPENYFSLNNHGLDPFEAFLKLDAYGLIEDDTPGQAATALEVLNFVFEVLNGVGGVTHPTHVQLIALKLNRWDICKALGVGNKNQLILSPQ